MSAATTDRTALVTGATGYVGGELVPVLLDAGWRVRVLTRDRDRLRRRAWADDVDIVQGDATSPEDCERALTGVDVAYYLVHSMDGSGSFAARDRALAQTFAHAASRAGTSRIVYLGGLHPDGPLSDHLASRVEVGRVFLDSSVPAVVLQAGVVLGSGSASFDMLRHLTERLPAMVAPRWLDNRIQPIGVRDVTHYLAKAADVPPDTSGAYDIGGPDVLTYREMMQRYARLAGLRPRLIVTVPVLTPRLAGLWVGLVTPLASGLARPLVDSLVHDAVCGDDRFDALVEPPDHGPTGFDAAVTTALGQVDPTLWWRTLRRTTGVVGAAAVAGAAMARGRSQGLTAPGSAARVPARRKSALGHALVSSAVAASTAAASAELAERGARAQARRLELALVAHQALRLGLQGVAAPGGRSPARGAAEAALVATTAADLSRRAAPAGRGKAGVLAAYAVVCAIAGVAGGVVPRRARR